MDNIINYLNQDDLVNDMRAKGGSVKFLEWLIAKLNASLKKMFAEILPPTGEPATDDEVLAFVQASLRKMQFTLVNGVPVLS